MELVEAVRQALSEHPLSNARVSFEGNVMTVERFRDGVVEHVVEAPIAFDGAEPGRARMWATALVSVLENPDFVTHIEVTPALLARRELVTVDDFRRALLDDKYCLRAEQALNGDLDVLGAIGAGNDVALRDMLDADASLVNADHEGQRLVHAAAGASPDLYGGGDVVAVLKLLIARGADVNATAFGGNSPAHFAQPWAIPILVAAGARLDQTNEDGLTPLAMARADGNDEVVQAFVDAGAQ